MSITKHNIHKHELIGMTATVKSAHDRSHVDMKGKIVDETKNTFTLEVAGKEKMLPKKGTVLTIELKKGPVNLDCGKLTFRPEDRIKKLSSRRMT
jgi:ribonuclease P protein subunit POP4